MPRSTYIYMLRDSEVDDILLLCTVKYELVNWLRVRKHHEGFANWTVERVKDGEAIIPGRAVAMGTAAEFLEDNP